MSVKREFKIYLSMFFAVSIIIVGRTAGDALFLSRQNIKILPFIYLFIAIFVALSSSFYIKEVLKRGIKKVLFFLSALTVSVNLFFWFAGIKNLNYVFSFAPVWAEVQGTLFLIIFWNTASMLYDTRTAKSRYPYILASGLFANISIGYGIKVISPLINVSYIFLFNVLTIILFSLFVSSTFKEKKEDSEIQSVTGKEKGHRLKGTFSNPYTLTIASIVMLTFLSYTFLDFLFKYSLKENLTENQMASYLGTYNVLIGLASIFTQLFISTRFISRLGLFKSISVFPVLISTGSIFTQVRPSLFSFTTAKFLEQSSRYSIHYPSIQLLYLPLDVINRKRTAALMDGIVRPFSIGLGGLILLIIFTPARVSVIKFSLIFFSAGMLFLVPVLKKYYLNSLLNSLSRLKLNFDHPHTLALDSKTMSALLESINSLEDVQCEYILEILNEQSREMFVKAVERLISENKLSAVFKFLYKLKNGEQESKLLTDVIKMFKQINKDTFNLYIKEILELIVNKRLKGFVPLLSKYLNNSDDTEEVLLASAGLLETSEDINIRQKAKASIKRALESNNFDETLKGLRALEYVKNENFDSELKNIITNHTSTKIRKKAIVVAGSNCPEIMEELITSIGEKPDLSSAFVKAISKAFVADRERWKKVFYNVEDLFIKNILIKGITRSNHREGLTFLSELGFNEGLTPYTRIESIICAEKVKRKIRDFHIEIEKCESFVDNLLKWSEILLKIRTFSDEKLSPVCNDSLGKIKQSTRAIVFLSLKGEKASVVRKNLDHPRIIPDALELAENLLNGKGFNFLKKVEKILKKSEANNFKFEGNEKELIEKAIKLGFPVLNAGLINNAKKQRVLIDVEYFKDKEFNPYIKHFVVQRELQ